MIKQIIKYGIYISCFVSFICFSYQSVLGFISGDVVYNVIVQHQGFHLLPFVHIVKRALSTWKLMRSDLGLKDGEIEGYNLIFPTLYLRNDTSDLIEKYSFFTNESLIANFNRPTLVWVIKIHILSCNRDFTSVSSCL